MVGIRRAVACALLASTLGVTTSPAYARGGHHGPFDKAGEDSAKAVGEIVAIAVGVTVGVLAITGASLWYYLHRRHARRAAPASTAPEENRPPASLDATPMPDGAQTTAPPS